MRTFNDVSLDPETRLLFETEAKLDDYDVLYQRWSWSGVLAESFIFHTADLMDLDDAALEALARRSPIIQPDSAITTTRGEQYTFVNFNFVILD